MKVFTQIKDKLTDNYQKSMLSKTGRLMHLVSRELNFLQLTFERIDLWRGTDAAQGISLDRLGSNFYEARSKRSDAEYRLAINTKYLSQRSGGDIESINSAGLALYGDLYSSARETWNIYKVNNGEPAAVMINVKEGAPGSFPSSHMRRIVAAGIRILTGYQSKRKLLIKFDSIIMYEIPNEED